MRPRKPKMVSSTPKALKIAPRSSRWSRQARDSSNLALKKHPDSPKMGQIRLRLVISSQEGAKTYRTQLEIDQRSISLYKAGAAGAAAEDNLRAHETRPRRSKTDPRRALLFWFSGFVFAGGIILSRLGLCLEVRKMRERRPRTSETTEASNPWKGFW